MYFQKLQNLQNIYKCSDLNVTCPLIIFHFIPAFVELDEFICERWQIARLIYQDQIKDIYGRIRIS